MNRLPDVPSKLLRVALADFIACEQNSDYELNPYMWHSFRYTPNKCCVCFAGSVIANRLGAGLYEIKTPYCFDFITKNRLLALDAISKGSIDGFFHYMGMKQPDSLPLTCCDFFCDIYDSDIEAFIAWIEGFIGILEAEGL